MDIHLGSSPLTRGKLVGLLGRRLRGGLIPAHAGKTGVPGVCGLIIWAHPRSRGENYRLRSASITLSGSSPLTRGKPCVARIAGLPRGLIPAHAGKTLRGLSLLAHSWAHPRSRGENSPYPWQPITSWGSSPLTRGKPPSTPWTRPRGGLIPAHAGKTQECSLVGLLHRAHPRSRGENRAA